MTLTLVLVGLALIAFFLSIIGKDAGRGVPVGLFLLTLWVLLTETGITS